MNYSPLRYPGGKNQLSSIISLMIESSENMISTYIEPFSGGAGVALSLLFNGTVEQIVLNDFDEAVYSFWRAVLNDTDELIEKIYETPVNVQEWKKQKQIYLNASGYSVQYAFATFYLNRTNRSGILSAGPIGGYSQEGKWKIDARYSTQISNRILKIAERRNSIKLYNEDIRKFISRNISEHSSNAFCYFDPPYYNNGNRLYKNFLTEKDHREIADSIKAEVNCEWVVTYDDVEFIREQYKDYLIKKFDINYCAATKRKATEIIIFSNDKMFTCINSKLGADKIFTDT